MADRDTTATPYKLSADGLVYFRHPGGNGAKNLVAVRKESVLPNDGPEGRPLPLYTLWFGIHTFPLKYQFDELLVRRQWYFLPGLEARSWDDKGQYSIGTYRDYITRCKELQFPLHFLGLNWLGEFYTNPMYQAMDASRNPADLDTNGQFTNQWDTLMPDLTIPTEAGERYVTADPMLNYAMAEYPDAPRVFLISNNEAHVRYWSSYEYPDSGAPSKRFMDQYAGLYDRNTLEGETALTELWGTGYINVVGNYLDGIRSQMPAWSDSLYLLPYQGSIPYYGRWGGWTFYWAGNTLWGAEPGFKVWDGISPDTMSHYVFNDFSGMGQAFHTGNDNACHESLAANYGRKDPIYGVTVSAYPDATIARYAAYGETFTPARHFGMVRLNLWINRPRIIWDYFDHDLPLSGSEPWMCHDVLVPIHENELLTKFWRSSTLCVRDASEHPYNEKLRPHVLDETNRYPNLACSTDPPPPFDYDKRYPFVAVARVRGTAPNREWLIVTHAPSGPLSGVEVTLHDYGVVTLSGTVAGEYWYLTEGNAPAEVAEWPR